jgi:hypothetical protein
VDEVSLKCDECRDLYALALEGCGSAGANRFLAAHLSQEMHLAFLRLDGRMLRIAQSMLRASTNVMRRTSWYMQCGGVYQCTRSTFRVYAGAARTSFACIIKYGRMLVLDDVIIVANLVPLNHVLAGNYHPLTAQLVTF